MEKVGEVCGVRIVKKRAAAGPGWNDDLEEVYFQYSSISPSDPFPFFGAPHPVFSYYLLLPHQTPEAPSLSSQDSKFYVTAMSNSSLQLDLLVLCSLLNSSLIARSRGICVKGWQWFEEFPFLDNTEHEKTNRKILVWNQALLLQSTWTSPSKPPSLEFVSFSLKWERKAFSWVCNKDL